MIILAIINFSYTYISVRHCWLYQIFDKKTAKMDSYIIINYKMFVLIMVLLVLNRAHTKGDKGIFTYIMFRY